MSYTPKEQAENIANALLACLHDPEYATPQGTPEQKRNSPIIFSGKVSANKDNKKELEGALDNLLEKIRVETVSDGGSNFLAQAKKLANFDTGDKTLNKALQSAAKSAENKTEGPSF